MKAFNSVLEQIDSLLDEDGEIVFEDGCTLTDWSGGRYCFYEDGQSFGEGKICDSEEAIVLYNEHNKK